MSADNDKKARLASALRANLARRKAQVRARSAQETADATAGAGRGPDAESPDERHIVPKDRAG